MSYLDNPVHLFALCSRLLFFLPLSIEGRRLDGGHHLLIVLLDLGLELLVLGDALVDFVFQLNILEFPVLEELVLQLAHLLQVVHLRVCCASLLLQVDHSLLQRLELIL